MFLCRNKENIFQNDHKNSIFSWGLTFVDAILCHFHLSILTGGCSVHLFHVDLEGNDINREKVAGHLTDFAWILFAFNVTGKPRNIEQSSPDLNQGFNQRLA